MDEVLQNILAILVSASPYIGKEVLKEATRNLMERLFEKVKPKDFKTLEDFKVLQEAPESEKKQQAILENLRGLTGKELEELEELASKVDKALMEDLPKGDEQEKYVNNVEHVKKSLIVSINEGNITLNYYDTPSPSGDDPKKTI